MLARNIPSSTSYRTQCGDMRSQVKALKNRRTRLLCAKVKSSVKRLKNFINAKNNQQQCPLPNSRKHQTPQQGAGMTICKKLVAKKSLNIFFCKYFSYCATWSSLSECSSNPSWMLLHCPIACNQCNFNCGDYNSQCTKWAREGECSSNRQYMKIYCRKVSN